ncbi:MAG TPA: serine/threonine-protein kinase [Kofleriaceae bacterium]|nr:serine/threonine-protein kinase [Kofleriaceae bacterium]
MTTSSTHGVTIARDDASVEVTDVARPCEDIGPLFGAEGTPPQSRRIATEMPAVRPETEETAVAAVVDPRGARRASAPLIPGGERYELGGEIGRGGMGEVLTARDVQIGREVAIKRLHLARSTNAAEARFLREARIQGRLEHPAIPPVYELAEDAEGRPYFAMRKLEGVTLAATLRDASSPFTQQALLRAFVDICNAVDLAHSRRIIHRDLKPANILLGERGEVYVLDWGIARELDAPDAFSGAVIGTPGYMAPEQLRGERDLDERVDIYALGCMLYEIVTRRPLHAKGDAGIEQALRGEFPYDAQIPLELSNACRCATAVQRSQRTSSARELAQTVQRYLDGDRDLEQRRTLAQHHFASARAAFETVRDDTDRRSIVMREAGRALALDPTLSGAAELIGHLMLRAPATIPAAVHQEIDAIDVTSARLMIKLSQRTTVLYLLMLGVFIACGVRDVLYLCAYGGVATLLHALTIVGLRRPHVFLGPIFGMGLVALVAVLARMFTPVLVAPSIAAVVVGSTVFNPTMKRRDVIILTAGMLLAIGGVWIAELVGLVSETMTRTGDTVHLRMPVEGISSFPIFASLAFSSTAIILVSALSSWIAMREIRVGREKLVMQAWHLRQLV